MKKILLIILIIICVALVFLLGWFIFFRGSSGPVSEIIRDVLPFGTGDSINIPANGQGEGEEGMPLLDENGQPTTNLFRITDTPVAGAVAILKNKQTIIRYSDRATGHITDVNPVTLEKIKISNQTLPKIYGAYFRPDGNAVLYRSLEGDGDTITNMSLALTAPVQASSTDLYKVVATVLRGEVSEVAVGPANTLYYVLGDTGAVVSSVFNGSSLKTLYTSPYKSWRLTPSGNNLVITTKASSAVEGYSYSLNTASGALTKLLGPLTGLAVLPNSSGSKILYSYTEDDVMKLFVKDAQNNTPSEILPVTLAEKCVWSIKNKSILFCGAPISDLGIGEPDSWYKGVTHFSDRIWKFNTDVGIAEVIVEPKKTYGLDLDISHPMLTVNEDYLIFINRNDLSLWALKLE